MKKRLFVRKAVAAEREQCQVPGKNAREERLAILRNLGLLAFGAVICAAGFNGFALPHTLLAGGITGLSMLLYYVVGMPAPAIGYALLNVPFYVLGWYGVGRRFFWYSVAGAAMFTVALNFVHPVTHLDDPLLAALAAGALMGAGAGIALHSLGSMGGMDMMGIMIFQKYGLPMGRFSFMVNGCILAGGLIMLPMQSVLYSLVMLYVTAATMEYFLGVFNQRKVALVISEQHECIRNLVQEKLRRGCTLLSGEGGFSHAPKKVVLVVVNNFQIKRLEELVYDQDPKAFMITLATSSVLGEGFLKRKKY